MKKFLKSFIEDTQRWTVEDFFQASISGAFLIAFVLVVVLAFLVHPIITILLVSALTWLPLLAYIAKRYGRSKDE